MTYGLWEHGTFSIVAVDPDRKYWGVAVSTKPASVGAVVPWAQWKVGAIATQAMSNYEYGPDGLALLRRHLSAEEVVRRLTRADPRREHRQLGVVDARGRSAAWTGRKCIEDARHLVGEGFSCQGNMLASDQVVPAMARAFESTRGSLANRLMAALRAGESKGGDKRGMESAALVVVHREPWIPRTAGDRWVDVRVDRDPHPVRALDRLRKADEAETRRYLAVRAASLRRRRRRASE
jgi:uncharacterized Ntn-hydrolase superfamily protein